MDNTHKGACPEAPPRRARIYVYSPSLRGPTLHIRYQINGPSDRTGGYKHSGRPFLLSEAQVDKLEDKVHGTFAKREVTWKELGEHCGFQISGRSIQRAMEARGYKKCTACQKPWLTELAIKQRVCFSGPEAQGGTLEWELVNWDCVLWSDECTFQLGRHRKAKFIRKPDERYCLDCIQFRNKRDRNA